MVMSVILGWHTLAVVVAPAPDNSVTVQALRFLLHPYLTLFRLDNPWNFYAPIVAKGHQFRYMIEDIAGKRRTFVPTEELYTFHPSFWWFRAWYDAILDSPEIYGDSVAALLCRKHASLHPISITLLKIEQEDFSPMDQLGGKHPMDSEFVTVSTLRRVACSGE